MFDSKIYNDGHLIVGKMSGVIEPQSFINGIFWQIDSRNVGEVNVIIQYRTTSCNASHGFFNIR